MYVLNFKGVPTIYFRAPHCGSTHFLKNCKNRDYYVKSVERNGRALDDHTKYVESPYTTLDLRGLGFRVIGLIRDPKDWILSRIEHHKSEAWWASRIRRRECDVDIINALTETPMSWYVDENNESAVDVIYRIEDIADFIPNYTPGKDNEGSHPYWIHWDKETEDAFQEKFHRELEYYPELRI